MQNVVFGIVTGSILAVATLGFALVRQTENFLNIAHAQMMALGAFVGVVLVDTYGMNIFVAGAITVVGLGDPGRGAVRRSSSSRCATRAAPCCCSRRSGWR